MKEVPGFLDCFSTFGEGDDNSYCWSTRIPKGADQFLHDIEAEYSQSNKSQTLKLIIQFAYSFWNVVAEQQGETLSERFKARIDFRKAESDALERESIINDLNRRLAQIERTDHLPLRIKLAATGQKLAEQYGISWPPPETPLVIYDEEARYLHNRIITIAQNNGRSKISLRELNTGCKFRKEEIMPVLGRLKEAGYIDTKTEHVSGPPTVWIEIPSLDLSTVGTVVSVERL